MPVAFERFVLGAGHHQGRGKVQCQILFAHCTSMVKEAWRPLYSHLNDALDARGIAAEAIGFDFSLHGSTGRRNLTKDQKKAGKRLKWIEFCPNDIFSVLEKVRRPKVPLVGVGHSMGGAGLTFAELERPGTFDHLILYEPILRPPGEQPSGVSPMVTGTLKRRCKWSSRDEARSYLAQRGFYKAIDSRVLDAFVAHGINDEGELKCTREDEARCYSNDGQSEKSVWGSLSNARSPQVDVWAGGSSVHLLSLSTAYKSVEEFSRALQAAFPPGAGTHRVFESRGHFAPLDDPEWFALEIAKAVFRKGEARRAHL